MSDSTPTPSRKRGLQYAVAKGAAVVLAGQLFGRFFQVLFRLGAARYLQAGPYGLLVLAITMSKLASQFGRLGFDRVALRFGSEEYGNQRNGAWAATIRLSLLVSVIGGFLMGALLCFFAPALAALFNKPDAIPLIRILAASVTLLPI